MHTIADVIARFICLFSKHGRFSKLPDPEFGGESGNMSLLILSYCSEEIDQICISIYNKYTFLSWLVMHHKM